MSYQRVKRYEIYGQVNGKSKMICELEARSDGEAIRKGMNFCKIMNCEFIVAKETQK